jgi:hypothetical protein
MVFCDGCDTRWHTFCLEPHLAAVPEGIWLCPRCTAAGISPEAVAAQVEQRDAAVEQHQETVADALASQRRARAAAQAAPYDGVAVTKKFRDPGTRRWRAYTPAVPAVHLARRMGRWITSLQPRLQS